MSKRIALISGGTGQDASYLSELLLEKDYRVFSIVRRTSQDSLQNIRHLLNEPNFEIVTGDLGDQASLNACVKQSQCSEFYNLGSQSFVGASWDLAMETANITGLGCLRALEAIKEYGKPVRFYQASSSEMFGSSVNDVVFHVDEKAKYIAYHEGSELKAASPYGAAKIFAHHITVNYRNSYNIFAVSGILFNHESPRRSKQFVTRKTSDAVSRIKWGLQDHISLGQLSSRRDWMHAKDAVRGMWMMLQQPEPQDYVLASGETHSVGEFCELAFAEVGITNWEDYVKIDPRFYRKVDIAVLLGDASKAKTKLGWQTSVSFPELVKDMVQNDMKLVEEEIKSKA